MDRQMKGEYFKMKNHGLRRIFSLLLALFMVFTLLPTTALAEDTTGADETPPKTVVVNEGEKKTDPPPRAGAAYERESSCAGRAENIHRYIH